MKLKLIVNERRRGLKPIPSLPVSYLNRSLLDSVKVLKQLGWRVVCIRRKTDKPVNIILVRPENRTFGLLCGDGGFKVVSEIHIRDSQKLLRKFYK